MNFFSLEKRMYVSFVLKKEEKKTYFFFFGIFQRESSLREKKVFNYLIMTVFG